MIRFSTPALGKETAMSTKKPDSPEMAAYRAHRQRLAELRAQETRIENLMVSTEAVSVEARAKVPDLSHFTALREELLTDLVLGKASQSDLETMDHEISERQQERDLILAQAKQSIEDSEQTILGLRRRLGVVVQDIAKELQSEEHLITRVLLRHAEDLGEDYVRAARDLKAVFLRLLGINGVLMWNGRKQNIYSSYLSIDSFKIPSFNLDSCRAAEHPNWPGELFKASLGLSEAVAQAATAERKVLCDQGLDCA